MSPTELTQAEVDYERRVRELREINEALFLSAVRQHELTEQAQKAEQARRESEERLEIELAAMQRLQEISIQMIHEDNVQALYEEILDAAVDIMRSDMASLQIIDEGEKALRLQTWRGFEPVFGKLFELVGPSSNTSCAFATANGHRMVVPDVETCDFIAGTAALENHRKMGIRAVQSTPLVSRGGPVLGVMSTHWGYPHQPSERDLHLLDVLARQAADLIERAQANQALRESETRFRSLVSLIADVPWITNAAGEFIQVQMAWQAYTEQSWEEQRGFGWINALHSEDRERVVETWRRACKSGTHYQSNGRLWHAPSQQWRHVTAKATPLLNPDGSVREWVGTYTDCEDQKRAEEYLERVVADRTADLVRTIAERERLQEQLLQAQKMESIGTLASGIAHDFNNLLNIISSYAGLMRLDRENPARVSEDAGIIEETVRRGANLVQQLMSVARKSVTKLEPVRLNSVIEKLSGLLAETFDKTIRITLDLEPGLPAINGDENQLHQILLNLCLNARDAMPEGGRISFRSETVLGKELRCRQPEAAAERYASISVIDRGEGIDEAIQRRIFEPFFTTKPIGQGSGIGLAVVYGLVKNHGGFIEVQSQIGSGTRFSLYLPIPNAASAEIAQTEPKGPVLGPRGHGETILFVDDEEQQLKLMSRFLESEGYRVLGASDGLEAIEIFKRHKDEIAVTVLDLRLPKLDGWQALQQMRTIRPDLKALIATGLVSADVETQLAEGRLNGIMMKPYRLDDVLEKIFRTIHDEAG